MNNRSMGHRYAGKPAYRCGSCRATGCKLWREGYSLAEPRTILCAKCAGVDQKIDVSQMDSKGRIPSDLGWTDQIGNWIPAIPRESSFWTYIPVMCEEYSQAANDWDNLPNLIRISQ